MSTNTWANSAHDASIATSHVDTVVRPNVRDVGSLQVVFLEAANDHHELVPFAQTLTRLLRSIIECDIVGWFCNNDASQCAVSPAETIANDDAALLSACQQISAAANSSRHCEVRRLAGSDGQTLVAVPVPNQSECFVAIFTSATDLEQTQLVMQLAAAQLAVWHVEQNSRGQRRQLQQTAAITELVARISSCDNVDDGCQRLASELVAHLRCKAVVVGSWDHEHGKCEIKGISPEQGDNSSRELLRASTAALEETIVRGQLSVWPVASSDNRHALLALKEMHRAHTAESVVCLPMRDDAGRIRGACAIVSLQTRDSLQNEVQFLEAAELPIASALGLLQQNAHGRVAKAIQDGVQFMRGHRAKVVTGLAFALLLAMFIPLPYRVKCDCTVEPVVRRYIAAPFAGPLEKAVVKPGDIVQQNQLLARMDGRDVNMELASVRAELYRATKERAGHMAAHEFGKTKLSQHDVERLTSESAMLEQRFDNLEVRSPIDGIVVSGDLEEAEGMPMDVGQTMFEIAPLTEMIVELAIPESDVNHVKPDMHVNVFLDALPLQRLRGTIQRVHPRSEIQDNENVFVAVVCVSNESGELRPGMKGRATVTTKPQFIGWSLFHRPLAAVQRWVGW